MPRPRPRYRVANVRHIRPDLRFLTLRLANDAPGNYPSVYVSEHAGPTGPVWTITGFSTMRDGDLPGESHPRREP